jgi:MSHA biogenesis protein MshN
LLSLVREWTRMQMAQGRYGPVWDTLSRLEPVLANAPDLWGLRGNTAQRLGHHVDSVNAYTAALQSRPNEQRWMLGAAVSMAALGQTDQAAAMVEKAQSVGDISREVQTYLHQMGVPLKAR